MSLQELSSPDPFAAEEIEETDELVHIRVQQRNGRKTLTTVQGLSKNIDYKKLLKAFKKEFACNGTLVDLDDAEGSQVIQLQGDQRTKVADFLVNNGIVTSKAIIKLHGF